jgi:hypothetical protein
LKGFGTNPIPSINNNVRHKPGLPGGTAFRLLQIQILTDREKKKDAAGEWALVFLLG